MMLEVMMTDCPGRPHPPAISWNTGMVMHVLKSDLVLRELEHVQVDGLGTAYLFFYDKQGHRGLGQATTYAIWAHMEETFSGLISCFAHFTISLLPLIEAWQQAVVVSDHQRLRSQDENPVPRQPTHLHLLICQSGCCRATLGSSPCQLQLLPGVPER